MYCYNPRQLWFSVANLYPRILLPHRLCSYYTFAACLVGHWRHYGLDLSVYLCIYMYGCAGEDVLRLACRHLLVSSCRSLSANVDVFLCIFSVVLGPMWARGCNAPLIWFLILVLCIATKPGFSVLCSVCVVIHFFWLVNACFCCVRFRFFFIPSQEIGLGKRH